MKKHLHILLTILFYIVSFQIAIANHFIGADITYKCLGTCNYRVEITNYYDCYGATGATPPNPGSASLTFACNPSGININPIINLPWTLVSSVEITPVCPGTATLCTQASGVSFNGVIATTYFQQYNLCNFGCNEVCVSWSGCCRNYAITSGAGGGGIHTSPVCIDLVNNVCNNSPVFKKPPHVYICAGQYITVNQGATDIDGDSLSYNIGNCYASGTTLVNYSPGYSPTSPLGSTWLFSMNPVSGDISIIPNPGTIQVGVLCVYVKEWRKINGVYTQIGEIERDIQLTVINCPNANVGPWGATPTNPATPISNLTAAAQVGTTLEINACTGIPFAFDFTSIAPNATGIGMNQQIDTMKISGAIGNVTFTAQAPANQLNAKVIYGHSPLIGHFNVLFSTPGTYLFTVTLKDNACPLYGINDFTLIVHANCCSNHWASADNNGNGCLGNSIGLNAVGGTSYNWTGPNGFSSILQNPILVNFDSNMVGTYNVIVSDTTACTFLDTFSVNLTANSTPIITASNTGATCEGDTLVLNANSSSSGFYMWTGLNNFTAYGQNVTINNVDPSTTGTYVVTITDNNNCTASASTQVNINPPPNAIANSFGTICEGETLYFFAMGGVDYLWNGPNGYTSNSQGITMNNVSLNMAGLYTVMVTDTNNCTATATTNVILNPKPVPNANATFNLFWGDSIQLNASGGLLYAWQPPTNLSDTTIANPMANPNITTTYYVTVTNAAGCKDVDTVLVNVSMQSITPAAWAQFVTVSPNPTDGNLFVNATDLPKDEYSINLYAINGQLIKNEDVSVVDGHLQIAFQLENMSSAVYLLRIISKTGNGEFSMKVQKK